MPSKSEALAPIRKSRTHSALTENRSSVFTKYIGKLKVEPAQQLQMSLGVFGADKPAKGFSIGITPDPNSDDTVATETIAVGTARRYELFLSVANFGEKTITAEVWRI